MNTMVMIRDLELLKKITVKDFEYFLDHRTIIDQESDPLFGRNLFSLKGKDLQKYLIKIYCELRNKLQFKYHRSRMEGHEVYPEPGFHQLQNPSDGAFHGGCGRSDDEGIDEEDQSFWR